MPLYRNADETSLIASTFVTLSLASVVTCAQPAAVGVMSGTNEQPLVLPCSAWPPPRWRVRMGTHVADDVVNGHERVLRAGLTCVRFSRGQHGGSCEQSNGCSNHCHVLSLASPAARRARAGGAASAARARATTTRTRVRSFSLVELVNALDGEKGTEVEEAHLKVTLSYVHKLG